MSVILSDGLAASVYSISKNPSSDKIQYGIEYCHSYHKHDDFINSYEFVSDPDIDLMKNAPKHYSMDRTETGLNGLTNQSYIEDGLLGDITKIEDIQKQLGFIKNILFDWFATGVSGIQMHHEDLLTFVYYLLIIIIRAYVKYVKLAYLDESNAYHIYNVVNDIHNIINFLKTVDYIDAQKQRIVGQNETYWFDQYKLANNNTKTAERFYLFTRFISYKSAQYINVPICPANAEQIIASSQFMNIMNKLRDIKYDFNFGIYILKKMDILKLDNSVDAHLNNPQYLNYIISNYKKYILFRDKLMFEYNLYEYGRLIDILSSISDIDYSIFNGCFRFMKKAKQWDEDEYIEIYTGRYYKFINYYFRKQNFGDKLHLDEPIFHTLFMNEIKSVSKNIIRPLRLIMSRFNIYYLTRYKDVYQLDTIAYSKTDNAIIIFNEFPVYLNNKKYYIKHTKSELELYGDYHTFMLCASICGKNTAHENSEDITLITCKVTFERNKADSVIFQSEDAWYVNLYNNELNSYESYELPLDFTFTKTEYVYEKEISFYTKPEEKDSENEDEDEIHVTNERYTTTLNYTETITTYTLNKNMESVITKSESSIQIRATNDNNKLKLIYNKPHTRIMSGTRCSFNNTETYKINTELNNPKIKLEITKVITQQVKYVTHAGKKYIDCDINIDRDINIWQCYKLPYSEIKIINTREPTQDWITCFNTFNAGFAKDFKYKFIPLDNKYLLFRIGSFQYDFYKKGDNIYSACYLSTSFIIENSPNSPFKTEYENQELYIIIANKGILVCPAYLYSIVKRESEILINVNTLCRVHYQGDINYWENDQEKTIRLNVIELLN